MWRNSIRGYASVDHDSEVRFKMTGPMALLVKSEFGKENGDRK
jgi:ribosomal protein L11